MVQQQPPEGWYDDPQAPGQERYWAGDRWTEARRHKTDSPPPAAKPSHVTTPTERRPGLGRGGGPSPDFWKVLVGAIVLLVVISGFNACQRNQETGQQVRDAYCSEFGQDDPDC